MCTTCATVWVSQCDRRRKQAKKKSEWPCGRAKVNAQRKKARALDDGLNINRNVDTHTPEPGRYIENEMQDVMKEK